MGVGLEDAALFGARQAREQGQDLDGVRFRDIKGLDIVGIFPDYASAQAAWRAKAQATVDSAQTRYFVVHLHRLLEPPVA